MGHQATSLHRIKYTSPWPLHLTKGKAFPAPVPKWSGTLPKDIYWLSPHPHIIFFFFKTSLKNEPTPKLSWNSIHISQYISNSLLQDINLSFGLPSTLFLFQMKSNFMYKQKKQLSIILTLQYLIKEILPSWKSSSSYAFNTSYLNLQLQHILCTLLMDFIKSGWASCHCPFRLIRTTAKRPFY